MFVVISCPPVCSCHNLTVFHIFQWYPEVQHFCLGVPIILVGCKGDLRTDKALTKKLWASGQNVVTYIQVSSSTQCTVTVWLVLLLTSIIDYEYSILTGRRGQEETQRCAVHGVLCQIPGKCWRPIQTSSKASTDGNKSAGQSQRTGFVCFVLMQAHGCDWLTDISLHSNCTSGHISCVVFPSTSVSRHTSISCNRFSLSGPQGAEAFPSWHWARAGYTPDHHRATSKFKIHSVRVSLSCPIFVFACKCSNMLLKKWI